MADGFDLQRVQEQTPLGGLPFHTWTFPNGGVWTEFHRLADAFLLRFPGLADFTVRADTLAVACHPAPGVSADTAEHLYLNQVRPLVLSKQGKLVFHASAVEIDGMAVAFVAESGRGKSTLAASFALAGYPFLTDDGLVLEAHEHGFRALPSHPSIRLWEDSERALIAPRARRSPALHYTSKARFLADEDLVFCQRPGLLQRAYFLGENTAEVIDIQPMAAAEVLIEWVKHSFLLDIEERPRLASHFDQVAALANQSIHYRLDYPRHFETLPAVHQAIVAHVGGKGQGL